MNDQNFYVSNDTNTANNNMYQNPTPTANNTNTMNNAYVAQPQPQPQVQTNSSTFDYNQLYGNKTAAPKVEEKQTVVFEEEPVITNASIIAPEETQIKISNDELIPEFDASVLEVVPNQQEVKIEAPVSNVNKMAVGKQAEKEKNRSNIIFIAILFGVIIAAVMFLFPMMVKM